MDASQLPKGQSTEKNADGRPINLPGTYFHKESGATFITAEGDSGVIQADSLMTERWRGGWERVGDVPTRLELLEMRKTQEVKDATKEALDKGREAAEIKAATKAAIEKAKAEEAKAKEEVAVS